MATTTAAYVGSFSPPTNAHIEIIRRAVEVLGADRLVIGIGVNPSKTNKFNATQRKQWLRAAVDAVLSTDDAKKVEIDGYSTLTADFVAAKGATILLRGVRDSQDCIDEIRFARAVEASPGDAVVVLVPLPVAFSPVSSSLVREMIHFHSAEMVRSMVPDCVYVDLAYEHKWNTK